MHEVIRNVQDAKRIPAWQLPTEGGGRKVELGSKSQTRAFSEVLDFHSGGTVNYQALITAKAASCLYFH